MIYSRLAVLSLLATSVEAGGKKGGGKGGKKSSMPVEPPTPEDACSARENGAEVFPPRDPAEQQMKLVQTIDTETCTYELSASFKPDTSLPFIDYPTRAPGTDVFTDVPPDFAAICAAEGINEALADTADSILTPERHVGFNEHYVEYSYTIFTDDMVAEKTGIKDVVVGAAPCGTGLRPFPQHSVHFYTKSIRGERADLKCYTGGGFFCKSIEEQCSERARNYNMDGAGLTCPSDPSAALNLPAAFTWTTDIPEAGQTNAASASQGLHGIRGVDFFPGSADIPQHLFLNYDGELIANHVIIWSGFSKGLARQNKFEREFPWTDCREPEFDNVAASIATEYDPISERTTVSIKGNLKDCSGESFTKTIDYSTDEPVVPPGSCGRQILTLVEAPEYIYGNRLQGTDLPAAGDMDVFQDTLFAFDDITNDLLFAIDPPIQFFVPFGMPVAKLTAPAGQHVGMAVYIRGPAINAPTIFGGDSPSMALSDIFIDSPEHGTGSIKVHGYADVFGEGTLAVVGGTGDFEGAYGTVSPEYGFFVLDDETLDTFFNGTIPNEGFAQLVKTTEATDLYPVGTPLSFAPYLKIDFKCAEH